jgi:hypothetical protein
MTDIMIDKIMVFRCLLDALHMLPILLEKRHETKEWYLDYRKMLCACMTDIMIDERMVFR